MKERILLFVVAALIVCFVSCSHQDSEEIAGEANAGFFAMNTYISMTAYGDQADPVLEEAESRMKELEALWSVTEENSDIYAEKSIQHQIYNIFNRTAMPKSKSQFEVCFFCCVNRCRSPPASDLNLP